MYLLCTRDIGCFVRGWESALVCKRLFKLSGELMLPLIEEFDVCCRDCIFIFRVDLCGLADRSCQSSLQALDSAWWT